MNTSHMTIPGLHVGRGTSAGGLTVFPVWVDTPALAGIAMGTRAHISVAELDQGPSVGQLVVHNAGRTAALLVEGELLEGGWQHRALNKGILLESGGTLPGSGVLRGGRPLARRCQPHPPGPPGPGQRHRRVAPQRSRPAVRGVVPG